MKQRAWSRTTEENQHCNRWVKLDSFLSELDLDQDWTIDRPNMQMKRCRCLIYSSGRYSTIERQGN